MQCTHEEYTVLKTRGREIMAQCSECGEIFTIILEKEIRIPMVFSRHGTSEKASVMLRKDRKVIVGEVLVVDGEDVEVHAIEIGERRPSSALVTEITGLWGISLSFPNVIGISVHHPHRTTSYKAMVDRDAWFSVGDVLQIGAETFEVTNIMTGRGKRAKAPGDDIKRLYGRPSTRLATVLLEAYDG